MARSASLTLALRVCACGCSPAFELATAPEFEPEGQTGQLSVAMTMVGRYEPECRS
jgi:hypothetical protein